MIEYIIISVLAVTVVFLLAHIYVIRGMYKLTKNQLIVFQDMSKKKEDLIHKWSELFHECNEKKNNFEKLNSQISEMNSHLRIKLVEQEQLSKDIIDIVSPVWIKSLSPEEYHEIFKHYRLTYSVNGNLNVSSKQLFKFHFKIK